MRQSYQLRIVARWAPVKLTDRQKYNPDQIAAQDIAANRERESRRHEHWRNGLREYDCHLRYALKETLVQFAVGKCGRLLYIHSSQRISRGCRVIDHHRRSSYICDTD